MQRKWYNRFGMPDRWQAATLPAELRRSDPALAGRWQCDLGDERLHWSPSVYRLFGLEPGRAPVRRDIVDLYCPESRERMEALRADAIARCGSFTMEARIRRPDGDLRWIRLTADVVCANGRAVQLYGTKQDVTAELG